MKGIWDFYYIYNSLLIGSYLKKKKKSWCRRLRTEEEERKKNMKAKNPQFWRSTKRQVWVKGAGIKWYEYKQFEGLNRLWLLTVPGTIRKSQIFSTRRYHQFLPFTCAAFANSSQPWILSPPSLCSIVLTSVQILEFNCNFLCNHRLKRTLEKKGELWKGKMGSH